ncbi:glyoxalase [Enterobacteriaceae bacterium 4M9]|nr:glyoxalase [Enterobacteriaceae bacterium 4M9]
MQPQLPDIDVLFVAGFGPITRHTGESVSFYQKALGLPLKPMPDNPEYWLTDKDALGGVKHFALWPLEQAALSCFGCSAWPQDLLVPQAWVEFEVQDLASATQKLTAAGYRLLVAQREEPWGQSVTRLLSPEGLLAGVTVTPWLREH